MTDEEINTRFTYHAPKDVQKEKYTVLRTRAKEFARLIELACPESREKSLAMTKLEESVMWANAAIARRSSVAEPKTTLDACEKELHKFHWHVDVRREFKKWQTEKDRNGDECYLTEDAFAAGLLIGFVEGVRL